ncbi:MAG: hypothetical protein K6F15_07060 [Treponema sp.]|nr:hypothetical protein [Treponema sp.]
MKTKILIFFLSILISSNIFSQDLPPEEKKPKENFSLFKDKETALYTNINLSGGFSNEDGSIYPQAKLKIDIAEGVFAKFSLASSASISFKNMSDEGIKKLSLSIPNFIFGYYIWNFEIFAGAGFYQCWYFKEETSNYISILETVHSYGYEINAGLNYSITPLISVFFEYSLTPHRWILKTNDGEVDWIYPNDFNLGVSFSIPWKI